MSGSCCGWALRHGPADRSAKLVLIAIADVAGRDGTGAHPGIPRLMAETGLSKSRVLDLLRRLEADGYVEVTGGRGGGRGIAVEYRLCLERVQPAGPFADAKRSNLRDRLPAGKGPARRTLSEGKGPADGTVSGAKGSSFGRETVQLSDPTLSYTTVSTTKNLYAHSDSAVDGDGERDERGDDSSVVADVIPISDEVRLRPRDDPAYGFDRFWDRYPRRNGRRVGKAKTLALWKRLPYDTKAQVWRAVQHYRIECDRGATIAMDPYRWIAPTNVLWQDWLEQAAPVSDHPAGSARQVNGPAIVAPMTGRAGTQRLPGGGLMGPNGEGA